MKKAESSREVSNWESLNRDILELIFAKLNIRDLTKGASRVCISWFLASHSKTLWNTVDFDKLRQVKEEGLKLRYILKKISKFFSKSSEVTRSLTNITKFSRTTPKNLFFRFNPHVYERDLLFAAVRMPNIEKLALPCLYDQIPKESFQFAFSKWKNLKTLIIAHGYYITFNFQAVGENCSNLTNFKYLGYLTIYTARQIVRYLKNLKRLSLRGSFVMTTAVLLLIIGPENLAILNLSHCKNFYRNRDPSPIDNHVLAAAKKLDNFIICTQDCSFCKDRRGFSSLSKHWRYDEIDELEF